MNTAMIKRKIIFTILLCIGGWITELKAQLNEYNLISHQEFMSYYNPAILNSGTNASLTFFHRNQWEGIGASNNLLFFERPFLASTKSFSPVSWGVMIQQEEFTVFKRNAIQAMYTGQLKASKYESLKVGISLGVNMTRLNTDDLNVLEFSDPRIVSINDQFIVSSRLGISYQRKQMEIGLASGFTNLKAFTSLHTFVKRSFELKNPDYVVTPMLIGRVSEDFTAQLEGQARLQYKQIINITAGYRQNFGMLFQLGLTLGGGKFRGSFGYEVPNSDTKELGSTQEVFLGVNWKTLASKKRTEAIATKREKDSVRFARRDSIRAARLLVQQEKMIADSLAKLESNLESDLESETDSVAVVADLINFEEISIFHTEIHDNTHVIMDHIRFENGRDIISPESFEQLEELARYLKHHHHFRVEIQGHCDDIGEYVDNIDLSERRALAVTNYVLSRGINKDRIDLQGYGSSKPLVPNISEKNRSLNRRVEIVFHTETKTKE